MMSTTELDPTILKALGYFRSNYADSTDKLKAMLTEAIEKSKRNYETKGLQSFEKSAHTSGRTVKISGNTSDQKKRDGNSPNLLLKRPFEKVGCQDGLCVNLDANETLAQWDSRSQLVKKIQDSSDYGIDMVKKRFYAGGSSSLIEPSSSKISLLSPNGVFGKSPPVEAPPPEDFVLEMAGLACTVCKEMTVGSGNQLVECQDCHSLYHQDCHQPPVTDKDMNDPRRVWYCAKCKQKIKQENNLLLSPVSRTSSNSLDLSTDKTKIKSKPVITPFKRSELKSSLSSSSNNSAAPLSGWNSLSGKPSLFHKLHDEISKSSEMKHDGLMKKSSTQKEKSKLTKNHSKSLLLSSDAWAEALGAKSSNDKHKTSSKGASSNNNEKHATLSSTNPRLSASSGSTTPSKQKSTFNSLSSHKSAQFPKTSASSGSVTKSMSTHDSAANKMQLMKKKAAAKLQQKRTRI